MHLMNRAVTCCGLVALLVLGSACAVAKAPSPTTSATPQASTSPTSTTSQAPTSPTSGAPSKVYVIKWAVGQSPSDPISVAARAFQQQVQTATNGGLQVQLYYTGQLGSNDAVVADTIHGAIQMETTDPNFLVQYYPSAGFSDLPYLFDSSAQAYKFWDGAVGTEYKNAILAHTGLRTLAAMDFGFHSMWTSNGPVTSAGDYTHLKVSSTSSKVFLELWKDLGTQAVVLPLNEDYTSVQQGLINAVDLSPASGTALKLYEVMKYFTYTNDNYSTGLTTINDAFFKSLPPAYQKVLIDDAAKMQDSQRAGEAQLEQNDVKLMQQNGVHVSTLSSAERDQLISKVKPLYADLGSLFGADAVTWYNEWQKASKS